MTKHNPQYHLLPTDDPVSAVKILPSTAGLEPLEAAQSLLSPQGNDDLPPTRSSDA
jgi:hypothetical protein